MLFTWQTHIKVESFNYISAYDFKNFFTKFFKKNLQVAEKTIREITRGWKFRCYLPQERFYFNVISYFPPAVPLQCIVYYGLKVLASQPFLQRPRVEILHTISSKVDYSDTEHTGCCMIFEGHLLKTNLIYKWSDQGV